MSINGENPKTLRELFGDNPIRVRGQLGITNPTVLEFQLYLKGYLDFGAKELLLYRFHHGTGESESFSYALLIAAQGFPVFDYSYWVVFPDSVRMGGTGGAGYDKVEELIREAQSSASVKVIDLNISSEDFVEFLIREEKSWH